MRMAGALGPFLGWLVGAAAQRAKSLATLLFAVDYSGPGPGFKDCSG
jgi:hypothetical protein